MLMNNKMSSKTVTKHTAKDTSGVLFALAGVLVCRIRFAFAV